MNAKLVLSFLFVYASLLVARAAGRVLVLDDGEEDYVVPEEEDWLLQQQQQSQEVAEYLRARRDSGYGHPAPSYGGHSKGVVGPVYTFVKTDPQANFKWGVRHRVGAHYGR